MICGVAVATLLLPACATVTRGSKQQFVIESTPNKAEVALSTGEKCVTPCKLKLKRKNAFVATFNKPGYETLKAEVKSKFSGGGAAAGAGNLLVGGIIGAAVDGSSGALNDLKPNPLRVTLVASADPMAATGDPVPAADAAPAPADTAAPAAAAAPSGE
jgi:hypothetical protein